MIVRTFFFILAFAIIFHADTVRFSYSEKPEFQWKDLKGRPDRVSPYAALVNTGISQTFMVDSHGFLIKNSVEVTAFFYPKLSWYKPEFVTENLLRHERCHFAISEIHARLLRKMIDQFEFSSHSHRQIDSLYKSVEKQRLDMQAQFDLETLHSQNKNQEKYWEGRIKRELEQLKNWASKK